jgi:hypothetical protein
MKAVRVDELSYREGEATPGQFAWLDREGEPAAPGAEHRLVFCCPCGCGGFGSAPVRLDKTRHKRPEWRWDGDRDKPTLHPSVWFNKGQPGEWHGWLKKGNWTLK